MNGLYPRLEYDHSISLLTYKHTRKVIVFTSCLKQDRLQPIQEKKTTRVYTYTYIYIHIYMCICYLFFIIMCIVAKKNVDIYSWLLFEKRSSCKCLKYVGGRSAESYTDYEEKNDYYFLNINEPRKGKSRFQIQDWCSLANHHHLYLSLSRSLECSGVYHRSFSLLFSLSDCCCVLLHERCSACVCLYKRYKSACKRNRVDDDNIYIYIFVCASARRWEGVKGGYNDATTANGFV